jgi:hypothetical protein
MCAPVRDAGSRGPGVGETPSVRGTLRHRRAGSQLPAKVEVRSRPRVAPPRRARWSLHRFRIAPGPTRQESGKAVFAATGKALAPRQSIAPDHGWGRVAAVPRCLRRLRHHFMPLRDSPGSRSYERPARACGASSARLSAAQGVPRSRRFDRSSGEPGHERGGLEPFSSEKVSGPKGLGDPCAEAWRMP